MSMWERIAPVAIVIYTAAAVVLGAIVGFFAGALL